MSGNSEVLKVKLGGREFVLHEFPWKILKNYLPKIRSITAIDFTKFEESDLDHIADVMFEAVSVPDPDHADVKPITREEFEDLPIKLVHMMDAIPNLLKQAGVETAKPGEKKAGSRSASTN